MNTVSANENLICAVVAVEAGLAKPEHVFGITAQWLRDPSVRLADKLLADGIIDHRQHANLQQLLYEALRRGNGALASGAESASAYAATVDLASHQPGDDGTTLDREAPGASPSTLGVEGSSPGASGGEQGSAPPAAGYNTTADDAPILQEYPGRYYMEREYGRGGQARVLLAFDRSMGREVAFKTLFEHAGAPLSLSPGDATGELTAAAARFLREARIGSQLEHPNTVPVYELGKRADGTLYYTMRLVRGEPMGKALAAAQTIERRMKLLPHYVDICHAVAYAHSRGVIHRDIKPDNTLIGQFGETVLIDWGLAKVRGREDVGADELKKGLPRVDAGHSTETMIGSTLGTPAYMSPEQAEGRIDDIDERSDVWALGAVLYELLTGAPPFQGVSALDTVVRVIRDPVRPVAQLCPEAPSELAAVAEKALHKDPAQRYQSAQALAEDVTAYMTGKRVAAYEYSSWELVRRFIAKNRAAAAAASLTLAVILGALVVVSFSYQNERAARAAEEAARAEEARARREEYQKNLSANFHLAQAYDQRADRSFEKADVASARIYSAASMMHNPAVAQSPLYDAEFAKSREGSTALRVAAATRVYRTDFRRIEKLERRLALPVTPTTIAIAPTGTRFVIGSMEKQVAVWDFAKGEKILDLPGHTEQAWGAVFSPDGSVIATGSYDGKARLFAAADGKQLAAFAADERIVRVRLSPDGKRLATATIAGSVIIWDIASGKRLVAVKPHKDAIYDLAYAPDGKRLATAAVDRTIKLLDAESGRELAVLRGHDGVVYAVVFSPDGRLIGSAGYDRKAILWDAVAYEKLFTLEGNEGELYGIAFSPQSDLVATGGLDMILRLWDTKTGALVEAVPGHTQTILGLAFSADGGTLASVGIDQRALFWRVRRETGLGHLHGHSTTVTYLDFSPDGSMLASGSYDYSAILWDLRTGARRIESSDHANYVGVLGFSPDGKKLVTPGVHHAFVWDTTSGAKLGELTLMKSKFFVARFAPDGRTIATGHQDQQIRLWDASTFAEVARWKAHDDEVVHVDYSPDGRFLVSSAHDKTAKIWDASTHALVRTLEHQEWVQYAAFTHDNARVATAGKDGNVYLWRVADGSLEATLRGEGQWLNTVIISPDDSLLATAGQDRKATVWDLRERRLLLSLKCRDQVSGIAFSPDGKSLAVGDTNDIYFYPMTFGVLAADPAKLLEEAQGSAGLVLEDFDAHPR